jgi:hypothetical protein
MAAFCKSFEIFESENLKENGSLSDRVLPALPASTLFQNFKDVWTSESNLNSLRVSLRSALASTSEFEDSFISRMVNDLQPGEHYKNIFDGAAIAVVVATIYILEVYSQTQRAQEGCTRLAADEVEVILSSTDHMAFDQDPTAVQVAFHSFLVSKQPIEIVGPEFCCAVYAAQAEFFSTLSEFFMFIDDVATLAWYGDTLDNSAVENLLTTLTIENVECSPVIPAVVDVIPVTSKVYVDQATSPIRELFYSIAQNPFNYLESSSSVAFELPDVSPSSPPLLLPPPSLPSFPPPLPPPSTPPSPPPSPPPSLTSVPFTNSSPPPSTVPGAVSVVGEFDLEAALSELTQAPYFNSASRLASSSTASTDEDMMRALDLL